MERLRALLATPIVRRLRRPSLLRAMSARPLSTEWGFDRGTPVDRYYIERFLAAHADDIRGRTLEVKSASYTRQFGRGVTQADVLDIDASNPDATIVADLAVGAGIPERTFDCFVLTQTLQLIYDVQGAVAQSHRLLRPGGVLLVTVPIVSRIVPRYGLATDYWRFTPASCARLFGDVFGPAASWTSSATSTPTRSSGRGCRSSHRCSTWTGAGTGTGGTRGRRTRWCSVAARGARRAGATSSGSSDTSASTRPAATPSSASPCRRRCGACGIPSSSA